MCWENLHFGHWFDKDNKYLPSLNLIIFAPTIRKKNHKSMVIDIKIMTSSKDYK